MPYFNRNKEKVKLTDMEYLTSGSCARIFHNQEIIFKQYISGTLLHCKLSEKMFDILAQINNPHFIELFDIYSYFNFNKLSENKKDTLPFIVDAYTAKYYPDDSINVLFEHKDYILDNFRELEKLFRIFSENRIYTDDIRRANSVIGKDGIVIIDPDFFYQPEYLYSSNSIECSKEHITMLNKSNLLNLFRSILVSCVENEPNYENIITFINNELTNLEVKDNTDVTHELSKKLKYIKKPIELFRS